MTRRRPVFATIAGRRYRFIRPAVHAWVPEQWCDCPDEPAHHWHRYGRIIYQSRRDAETAVKSALTEGAV